MDSRWYEDFFEGIALEVWRKAITLEETNAEVAFLERVLKLERGFRVLDVPSGLGRHSLELASRGYRMTGVDVSAQMIEEGRASALSAGLAIEWRQADMRDLSWEAEFDAGFCFGNSFGYLNAGGTRRFLEAVSRALKPGARFALDYGMAAECILPRFQEREWARIDDILFLEENHYDVGESCIETAYTFVRDGKSHRQMGLHWVYTLRETRQFLVDAGLEPRDVFGSVEGEPFKVGSPLVILVAEKR